MTTYIDINESIVEDVLALYTKGKSAAYIKAVVGDDHSLSTKDMALYYKLISEHEGWSQSGSKGDLEALVRVMRENLGNVERKELVRMMAEESGYTESTANHMLSQLNFAKEYAKQVNS